MSGGANDGERKEEQRGISGVLSGAYYIGGVLALLVPISSEQLKI